MAIITLTQAEHGKSIAAQVGDCITVSLDENPTTGFRWAIDKSDDDVVAFQSSEYAVTPRSRVGGGGQRIVTFEARKASVAVIHPC